MPADKIPASLVRSLFVYDPATGIITWVKKPRLSAPDGQAGHINQQGYRKIRYRGREYGSGHIAYAFMTGEWPSGEIDHINRNRLDNRWVNLRVVNDSVQSHNRGNQVNNSSGVKGVDWCPHARKYRARIKVNGKRILLGYGATVEAAGALRKAAERELNPARLSYALEQ